MPTTAALDQHGRVAAIAVANDMVAVALAAAISTSGWAVASDVCQAAILITDTPAVRVAHDPAGNNQVLVCDPTPAAARIGLDAFYNLLAVGLVCADQPTDVEAALAAVDDGRASVPLRLLRLAGRMPQLSERQAAILAAIAAGQSNAEIGRGLYLSATSVKREMQALYAAVGATTRSHLAARAVELGIPAHPVLP